MVHSRQHADNANQVEVPGYAVFNLRAGVRRSFGTMDIETFVGVNNLADRKYFSNLRINAAGDRYYEPAPERNFHTGVRVRF
ncbi:MAG: TonB-dependent receptor [Xanthomonadaceae bacterium]|nr:TonB-dependent receptor [Xanthomonadaceae bacterium]